MRRYVGKCKTCKAGVSALIVKRLDNVKIGPDDWRYSWLGDNGKIYIGHRLATADPMTECPNGHPVRMESVKGTYNPDVSCNAKCMGSKGPSCECSCGGKNHGASYG